MAAGRSTLSLPNLTNWLLAAVMLLAVLPLVLYVAFGELAGAVPLGTWLSTPIHPRAMGDSWKPIAAALKYVATHADASGLYQETYFRSSAQFIYSPLSLVFFQVVAFFGVNWASPKWMNAFSWIFIPAIGVCLFFLLRGIQDFVRMVQLFSPYDRTRQLILDLAFAMVSVLAFYPIMRGFALGQIQTWMTLALILSFTLFIFDKKVSCGILLALVAIIKPHLLVIAIWAALRREWRVLAGFIVTGTIIGVASLLIFGWTVHFEYLDLLGYLSKRGEAFHFSHSIESMLLRYMHNGNNLVWDGTHTQVVYMPWLHWTATACSLVILAAAIFSPRPSGKTESILDYAIVIASTTLASPVAYEHHFGVFLGVFLCAVVIWFAYAREQRWIGGLIALSYFLFANLITHVDKYADTGWNFVQSYLLWSSVLLLALLYRLKALTRSAANAETTIEGGAAEKLRGASTA